MGVYTEIFCSILEKNRIISMDFSINIKETDDVIAQRILIETRDYIKQRIVRIRFKIIDAVDLFVRRSIEKSDFYQHFIYGKLKSELGVVDPSLAMSQIINALVSTNFISMGDVRVYGNEIKSVISIKLVPDDFSRVLSVPLAQYVTAKGELIPWLKWVLFEGTNEVVSNYKIVFEQPQISRTGDAIMRLNTDSSWSVPSAFAGTVRNNFIVNSLNLNITELEDTLETMMNGAF